MGFKMHHFKIVILFLFVSTIFSTAKLLGQTAEDLYQKGVQFEEIKGELSKAIDVFSEAIKKDKSNKEIAAKAQLHIGLCYEKLGKDEAVSAFQKVITLYPSQKDVVQIAREKLASMNTDEADIQELKSTLEKWEKAFVSTDADKYCSYFSSQFLEMAGGLQKEKERLINNYFSKWKKLSLVSKIKSIDKIGYNYIINEEVSFINTDWNGNEKSELGVNRFITFTKEGNQWKILNIHNQFRLPDFYKKLSKNYPGVGNAGLAYVCHITQNLVSVINTNTNSLIGIIPSDYGACDIAFSKDRGYIANFNSDNIVVFNKKTNQKISTVPAGQNPCTILIPHGSNNAFISHQSNDGLWIMDIKDNQIINKIPGISGMMVEDSLNNKIFASAVFQPYIYSINPKDQSIIKRIYVGGRPLDIALSPDGKFLYVANVFLNEVQKINTKTDSIVDNITKIDTCRGIAISPDGKYAYVTNVIAGTVSVIDLKTDTKIKTLNVGRMPTTISVDKNNNCAYVSNQGDSSISVIDTKKNEVIKTISVADNPIRVRVF